MDMLLSLSSVTVARVWSGGFGEGGVGMGLMRASRWLVVSVAVVAVLVLPVGAHAEPPGVPSPGEARAMLGGLVVAAEGGASGYSRQKFPHWSTTSGECTTRETVLRRDGSGVEVDALCRPTAGSWRSLYDDTTVTDPSKIDIDHVVPLAEAWRSGADTWSTEERERFANDLGHPQLVAVTAAVNRAKGDQDPAQWLPPSLTYRCTYVRMWIAVKAVWRLSVQQAEKDALVEVLDGC
ncbi:HNH endonuclease family protein [Nocardia wallacei]|uniref:HNH endonuclease family protein n=1 Tax=Nocardia wallacei TaxID=480035 RepID=UPI002456007F|nr:HNH endonuclease family protein [Nocardia wallacei]